jgi:hypothetical protein
MGGASRDLCRAAMPRRPIQPKHPPFPAGGRGGQRACLLPATCSSNTRLMNSSVMVPWLMRLNSARLRPPEASLSQEVKVVCTRWVDCTRGGPGGGGVKGGRGGGQGHQGAGFGVRRGGCSAGHAALFPFHPPACPPPPRLPAPACPPSHLQAEPVGAQVGIGLIPAHGLHLLRSSNPGAGWGWVGGVGNMQQLPPPS